MDPRTRVTQQAEKPSRLQLAIIEWQRQLMSATSTSSTASTAG
jgi:uncharacterized protein YigA (DUF484 family)